MFKHLTGFFLYFCCFLQGILDLPESTYELCYNAACALIGQGKLTEAFSKLQQAEGQCFLSVAFLQAMKQR